MAEDEPPQKSFRDRLAMFNQPKAAAAPPKPAVKPKAFKWKTSSEQSDAGTSGTPASTTDADTSGKVINVADIPLPVPTPTPGATVAESDDLTSLSDVVPQAPVPSASVANPSSPVATKSASAPRDAESSGMSAADAKQKAGSLKDRIALLSGLKVEQPGVPGNRPLKPWKKPAAQSEPEDVQTAVQGDNITPGIDEAEVAAAAHSHAGDRIMDDPLGSPTDNLDRALNAPATDAKGEGAQGGVAMPAIPSRARGPPRKGRSGGVTVVASGAIKNEPADVVAPVAEPIDVPGQLAPQPPRNAAPETHHASMEHDSADKSGLLDIARPSREPSQAQLMSQSSASAERGTGRAENLEAGMPAEDEYCEPVTVPPKRRPSANLPKQADDDDEDWGDKRSDDEDDDGPTFENRAQLEAEETTPQMTLESSLDDEESIRSRQSTQSTKDNVASQVAPKQPALPPLSMTPSLSRASEGAITQAESPVTSPTLTNRRSMTRPPVPGAFIRDTSASSSPRPSIDASFDLHRSQDISKSHPQAPMRSVSSFHSKQADILTPSHDVMVGNEASPAAASPTVGSKPLLTPLTSPPMPARKPTLPAIPMSSPSVRSAPPLPTPGGSAPSRSNTTSEIAAAETNITAAMQSAEAPSNAADAEDEEEEYEDPEVARRQALAKRMAAIGGMKIGMLPMFGGAKKKKATLPPDDAVDRVPEVEDPPAPAPSRAAPDLVSPVNEESPASIPSPVRQRSFMPPPGAFVLPGLGKPTAPTPEEAIAKDESREKDEYDAEEPDEEQEGIDRGEDEEFFEHEAANTATADSSRRANIVSPPPLPGGRPSRPPPLADSSFIDTDTDTDGLASSGSGKANSLASSTLGSLAAFPVPPSQGRHTRMPSNLSETAYAAEDEQEEEDEAEYLQEDDNERQPETSAGNTSEQYRQHQSENNEDEMEHLPAPPAPPGRPAPIIDTGYVPTEPDSITSPTSFEASPARSTPSQPLSPVHNRQNSLSQAAPSSPSASSDGRRSSTIPLISTQDGQLSSAYLAQLATSAMRSKQRDIDGPLATAINDIANGYRADPAGFGSVVYRYLIRDKGNPPDLHILGRIEPGTIMFAWDAKFDKGLGRSSLRIGSATVPHVAIVGEEVRDMKKVKFRVVELARGSHVIEEYKIDNLKNGMVEIRRL